MKKIILFLFLALALNGLQIRSISNFNNYNESRDKVEKLEVSDQNLTALGDKYFLGDDTEQNYEKANELYNKACEAEDGYGCFGIGFSYELGLGIKQDSQRALEFYKKSCRYGNMSGCDAKEWLNDKNIINTFNLNEAKFKRGCQNGDAASCYFLGLLYEKGWGAKKSYEAASELYKKACDKNNGDGCGGLGNLYCNAKAVSFDDSTAEKLFIKACKLNSALGCRFLGDFYHSGCRLKDTFKDEPRSFEFYKKATALYTLACQNSDAVGCNELGLLQKRDNEKSEAVYNSFKKSCILGYPEGCKNLGKYYESKFKYEAGQRLYIKSCEMGSSDGCLNAADLYVYRYDNRGRKRQDEEKIIYFYKRSCDMQNEIGCAMAGNHVDDVKFDEKACELYDYPSCKAIGDRYVDIGDTKKAKEYYRRACDKSRKIGCVQLGELCEVEGDYGKAHEFYQTVCENNDNQFLLGCHRLAQLYKDGNGVKQDLAMALKLFKKSCDMGAASSCHEVDSIKK